MSTQLIGFSVGGIARRFLVSPPSMIWPTTLVNCALFNTLHSQHYAGIGTRGGMSRERFFVYAFIGSFTWCKYRTEKLNQANLTMRTDFFPGYICRSQVSITFRMLTYRPTVQALSYFSWVTWIAPHNTSETLTLFYVDLVLTFLCLHSYCSAIWVRFLVLNPERHSLTIHELDTCTAWSVHTATNDHIY
jgi:OPT oligopeptide transporter protein